MGTAHFNADSIDERNQAHRFLKLAVQQVLDGKAIVGCGTAVKALERARSQKDPSAGLLAVGFLADVLGVTDQPQALAYWRQAAPFFSEHRWMSPLVKEAWQLKLKEHGDRFLMALPEGARPALATTSSGN